MNRLLFIAIVLIGLMANAHPRWGITSGADKQIAVSINDSSRWRDADIRIAVSSNMARLTTAQLIAILDQVLGL